MKTFKQFISEALITPSNLPNTITVWHGGNLDSYDEAISHKKGRFEYGAGLYCTSHYGTAQRYSKGSRKLYQIVIEKGIDLSEVMIDILAVKKFISEYVIGSKRKDILGIIERREKDGKVEAFIFNNILINHDAIKPTNTKALREFLTRQGIDYCLVPNAFGWGEMMVVLYNMRKIVKQTRVMPNDKIEVFDLPSKFI
jgi:hypothetical protein